MDQGAWLAPLGSDPRDCGDAVCLLTRAVSPRSGCGHSPCSPGWPSPLGLVLGCSMMKRCTEPRRPWPLPGPAHLSPICKPVARPRLVLLAPKDRETGCDVRAWLWQHFLVAHCLVSTPAHGVQAVLQCLDAHVLPTDTGLRGP